jgi:hypothetical protein
MGPAQNDPAPLSAGPFDYFLARAFLAFFAFFAFLAMVALVLLP